MADAYTYPYEPPEFLQGQSVEEIHARMLDNLPAGIDKGEGNIPWDFTRPPAQEKAEFVEFDLNETIKLIFPQWSHGEWLDLHGERNNCIRRPANPASGTLSVTGTPGTTIPAGFQFATAASTTASVIFQTSEEYTLNGITDDSGMVTNEIDVVAVEAGQNGNVAADTIKLMVTPLSGITYVTNSEDFTGGTEEEEDSPYLIRILDAIRNGKSRTGCNADYKAWALEVAGVGQAIVEPEWDDPDLPDAYHYTDPRGNRRCAGAVRVLLIDGNGLPANSRICDAVYQHIAGSTYYDIERLMPVGAHLTVAAPEPMEIAIAATVLLDSGENLDVVLGRFKAKLAEYWAAVAQEAVDDLTSHRGHIRWVQVGAELAKTAGVLDYSELVINGLTENIEITQSQYPVTREVVLRAQS